MVEEITSMKTAILTLCTKKDDGTLQLTCNAAHKLAAKSNYKLADIGAICNEEGIRITKCELGCF